MGFREFYSQCTFTLLKEGVANWDYYKMQYANGPVDVVALAKPGTGAKDCFFGSMKYFDRINSERII